MQWRQPFQSFALFPLSLGIYAKMYKPVCCVRKSFVDVSCSGKNKRLHRFSVEKHIDFQTARPLGFRFQQLLLCNWENKICDFMKVGRQL